MNADGTFTYTPSAGFVGSDSFTYTICDDGGLCDVATVTLTVTEVLVNSAPAAIDDAEQTAYETPVTVTVLANDSDPDGDATTITNNTQPANGTVVLNADGTFTYTPNSGFSGLDSFEYTICDDQGACDDATVTINVLDEVIVNNPPVANDDSSTTEEDTPVTITVSGNDSDPDGDATTITSNTQPANGTVVLNADGTFIYTPNADFFGTDSFMYTICDAAGACDDATVTITVTETVITNTAPIAVDDNSQTDEDEAVTIFVLNNDSDPEGDSFTITSTTSPLNGSISIAIDGSIIYTPNAGFTGTDIFTYTICDASGGCDDATVTINVNAVVAANNPPEAVDDATGVSFGQDATIVVLLNDTDPDGDVITVTTFTQPSNGNVVLNGGVFTYSPDAGFSGTDSFTYQICDDEGLCDVATVTITVQDTGCPDQPVLCTSPITPTVVCPNYCTLSGEITVLNTSTIFNCSIEILENGCVQYTALPAFIAVESLQIEACDEFGTCETVVVTINVVEDCDAVNGANINVSGKDAAETNEAFLPAEGLALTNIAPVPTANVLNVSFTTSEEANATIAVYDLTGKLVTTLNYDAAKGMNVARLDVMNLATGVYVVAITTDELNVTGKFVKQ